MLSFGSVCSGIEAASVAWHDLGWKAAWLSEIDKAACEVLAYRFPDVPNHGDMLTLAARVRAREIAAPDILVGGTPCQSFSVAGMRKGLDDPRGQLTIAFIDLANAIDEIRAADGLPPVIIIWENVPGVLNHKDNPLGCFLAGLAGEDDALVPAGKRWTNAGAVFGPQRAIAWRVLDAQYFGLAQRRRRVFVLASARERFDPAAVLLEFDGVRRDSPPSREAGQGVAGTLDARTTGGGFPGSDGACSGHDVPAVRPGDRHAGLEAVPTWWDGRDVSQTLDAVLHKGQTMPEKNRFPAVLQPIPHIVGALATNTGPNCHDAGNFACNQAVDAGHILPIHVVHMAVRRLMPVECERLQGFPDDWTLVPTGKTRKPAADGPRYKQCGNSMATKVMRWIGMRVHAHLIAIQPGHNGGPPLDDFDFMLGAEPDACDAVLG